MNYLLNTIEGAVMNLEKDNDLIIFIKTITKIDAVVNYIIDYSDNFITVVKPNKEIVVFNINSIESMTIETITHEIKTEVIVHEGENGYEQYTKSFFKGFSLK